MIIRYYIPAYIPFLLFFLFLSLKLSNIIIWPWIWIFSPLWISLAIPAAIFLTIAVVVGVGGFLYVLFVWMYFLICKLWERVRGY